MSLTATVTPGKTFVGTELVTNSKLNQVAAPTVSITGTADTSEITDASVTSAKTKVGPHFFCANNSSAVNDYRVTTNATLTDGTVADGTIITFEVASATNTAASTFKADTMTARSLVKQFNQAVTPGDLRLGQMCAVMWDASTTTWQLLSDIGNPSRSRFLTLTSGSATAYTAVFAPTITALADGLEVEVRWDVLNTGAATFAPDGLTAKAIRKLNDVALAAGDLLAGMVSRLRYVAAANGGAGAWLLVSPVASSTSVSPVRIGTGLTVSRASASTLTVAATEIIVKNASGAPLLVSALSATADLAAAGGGASVNCRESGISEDASTWYYVWVISDGATAATLLNKSATTISTFPTGYGYKALVGLCYNNSASDITHTGVYRGAVCVVETYKEDASAAAIQNYTYPHPFGAVPIALRAVAVCATGELGYTAGQELDGSSFYIAGGYIVVRGWADTTNLSLQQGGIFNGAAVAALHATTAANTVVNGANWDLKLYATFAV